MRPVLFLLVGIATAGYAHDPITTKLTWTREISRIVQRRCLQCHREGGSAPMPLVTYEQARPWAVAIAEQVLERQMPPWDAVKGFGDFKHDLSLSQEEVQQIADWVAGGAPAGDPAYLPAAPSEPPTLPPVPLAGRTLKVANSLRLERDAVVTAIRPDAIHEEASVRVIARRPDGSIEPMLWLRNYRSKFARAFEYRQPLRLPAGTVVQVVPADAGSLTLFLMSSTITKR
ncbi:MAG: cytochrome c [Bryobacteraceae bacterium]|nr:cytochrome c [Bryobacteraceae bacterium]